ncbi:MAG: ABC transporter permease [Gammaproteobacteria bacterium]
MKLLATLRLLPAAGYVVLLYVFILLPVAVLVLFSFQDGRLPVPPLRGLTLRWYEQVLTDPRLLEALWNSVAVAMLSAAVATVLGFLAAYGLARHAPAGATLMRWLLMLPLSVSYLIIGMGLLIFMNTVGLPKSLWAVGIGHVVINLPLAFAILYSQMGAHQATLERAARDLGALEWQVLLLITVPLLWPALLAAFFLSVTLSWDEFIIAFLVTRFEVTLPVEIWSLLRSGLNPATNAVGTLVFGVSMAAVLVLELLLMARRRYTS